MATSTIQLERTIQRSQQYARLEPLLFAANTYNDPAFSNADWVMQTILAPPFAWRWNRTIKGSPSAPAFATIIGDSDYTISVPTFGWLEKATAYDPTNGYFAFELSVNLLLAEETLPNQATRIAAQRDDGQGNITFRIFPAADKVYNVVLEFQNAAQLFTSTSQTWAPIPDYLSYIYNEGFDAKNFEYLNDPRFQTSMQLFMTDLTAASEGLNQSQKNLWLTDRLNAVRQQNVIAAGRG